MFGIGRLALVALALPLSLAAVPASPAAASADDVPTYTCQRDVPAPRVYPPWAIGVDCTAAKGAPAQGERTGPVDILFPNRLDGVDELKHQRCRSVVATLDEGKLGVVGRDCHPRDHYTAIYGGS
ncbi:hypothetical protein HS048_22680 [Planomonospora sp. ID91781]|uniref:Secreted protein n=1 Tax=Planomonospora sphaerica TaxID=161355 RepID=A0A171CUH1_9ACTN|nr:MULTISPECIES: hypothetical protein [Planomonospora]MBG0823537.1 hypothetical protein [Planomonospora sp. ID91781]GAT67238.1 hypothetical protein PS9374_02891 [Planomonospora sphaerica]